uniref:Uncharacterized protein n=1 Tax=candidate division WOR-3 bacterium TaxID=2052148 RepID=A0A7C6EA36_UNCW3
MFNPKKVWLLYARRLYNILSKNLDSIAFQLKTNLAEVITELNLNLNQDQKEHLFEIALAFFQEEYLEAYRKASQGEEPQTKLSAMQSCIVVEETMGYPVTKLFQAMVQEIINNQDKAEEVVTDILIKKFGAYPTQAILKINLRDTPIPENHLPDFCLAKAIKTVVDKYAVAEAS